MEGDLDEANEKESVEVEISRAMRARVSDFKERADTLTLEGVRRALEKDLGMKTFSLDAHKRFIKQCLDECFYGANDENLPKTSGATSTQSLKEEKSLSEDNQPPSESRKDGSSFNKQIEDSPTTANKGALDHRIAHDQDSENDDVDEEKIRKAIESRVDYFREHCMSISLAEVRRTLEEDLKLKKKALDAYKSFITNELDKVLQIPADVKPTNGVKKQPKKVSQKGDEKKPEKGIKRTRPESDSSNNNVSVTEDEEDEEIRPNKRVIGKDKARKKSQRLKKSKEDDKSPNSSEGKTAEQNSGNSSEDDGGNSSQDSHSHTSKGDAKKKQEKPVQVYGKRVEQLKSIIKSCGMSVPPTVYRKAKQVSESKREASLIKELEQILKKEGLPTDPSEKAIKAIKRKKERARELEGIDMSNIVSSSRRRTTSSYIPPPKPKIEVESEDDEEDEENEEDTDEENEDDGSGSEDPEEGEEEEDDDEDEESD